MTTKIDIEPKNSKGQFHGYQEWYIFNVLWFKGNRINGERIGYVEVNRHPSAGTDSTEINFFIR